MRLPPATLAELGPVNWLLCRVISRATGTREAHLFTALARQRRLFRAWLRFAGAMMPGGSIDRHETEIVILRVAHLRRCDYELDHHVRLGRRVGIDADLLARIFDGPQSAGLSERQRVLLTAVDELVEHKDIRDDTWAALGRHLSVPQTVELCLLVGHYEMLATTITTLRIDRDFKG
jgi:AhpD family alkylhydroperoxidase